MIVHLRLVLSLIVLHIANSGSAQQQLILTHARPIDPERYDRIKGSPYIREEWFDADITPTSGDMISGVSINFNGYTGLFEVRQGEQFIEVENVDIVAIKIHGCESSCGECGFYKYRHPKLNQPFPYFVYNGRRWKLLKDFRITLVEKKIETPGKTEVFKTFNDVASYYLLDDTSLELIKLNKKDLVEKISIPGAEVYIKDEKLNLSQEDDVCRFLAWAESR